MPVLSGNLSDEVPDSNEQAPIPLICVPGPPVGDAQFIVQSTWPLGDIMPHDSPGLRYTHLVMAVDGGIVAMQIIAVINKCFFIVNLRFSFKRKPPNVLGGWRLATIKGNSVVYSIYSRTLQPVLEFRCFPLRGCYIPSMGQTIDMGIILFVPI